MAFSFMATIIVTTNSDSSDTEDIIRDIEEGDDVEAIEEEKVYIIDNANSVKYLNKYQSFNKPVKYFPFSKQR